MAATIASSQPAAEVNGNKKSFGRVKKGAVVKLQYEVSNKGSEPLLFSGHEAECSCTSVELPIEPLMPGKVTFITITFNSAPAYGRQDRTVLVHTNDPRGSLKLRFRGTVLRS